MIAARYRKDFAEHAGVEAIAAELTAGRTALVRAEQYVAWLEDLSAQRAEQIADGAWPPATAFDRRGGA